MSFCISHDFLSKESELTRWINLKRFYFEFTSKLHRLTNDIPRQWIKSLNRLKTPIVSFVLSINHLQLEAIDSQLYEKCKQSARSNIGDVSSSSQMSHCLRFAVAFNVFLFSRSTTKANSVAIGNVFFNGKTNRHFFIHFICDQITAESKHCLAFSIVVKNWWGHGFTIGKFCIKVLEL